MQIDKHYTATTYMLDRQNKRTLFHWHRKILTWLPPGGHIEKNETPEEAARREIYEEYRITEFEFIKTHAIPRRIDERCEMLLLPHFLLSEEIEIGHFHLDWIFYAWIDDDNINSIDLNLKWFDVNSIQDEQNCFENVKELALHGFGNFY